MPASRDAGPLARMATPRPSGPALAQKPDAQYAAVYAPMATKAT